LLATPVDRPVVNETTALGAAYLAGLAVGFWSDQAELRAKWQRDRTFRPEMAPTERAKRYQGWQRAVERSRAWVEE
ncbi:MAG TPA: glycerol kinase, partial [Symbiobacteriaceae bacterium]|nr:glycerol kinase [Symbiobacteriaceae bacterium]